MTDHERLLVTLLGAGDDDPDGPLTGAATMALLYSAAARPRGGDARSARDADDRVGDVEGLHRARGGCIAEAEDRVVGRRLPVPAAVGSGRDPHDGRV